MQVLTPACGTIVPSASTDISIRCYRMPVRARGYGAIICYRVSVLIREYDAIICDTICQH
eukprot:785979-Rhodomonas_salina.1